MIIAQSGSVRVELELLLHPPIVARSVEGAPDTEGRDVEVVVVAGAFPLTELTEVRAHPQLFDKPVVLFAPGRTLPDLDWRSMNVWPVTSKQDAKQELTQIVWDLLSPSDLSEAL